jgi:hypothetical protein
VAIIVVGGTGKDVGKTSLVCGLIAALPEFAWTAVKVTRHQHAPGAPSLRHLSGAWVGNLKSSQAPDLENPFWEETKPGQATDTARYLAAGAQRALLVASEDGNLPLDELSAAVGSHTNLIFESNTIATQLKPDLCLGVVGTEAEVKPSFEPFMRWMDAAVVLAGVQAVFAGSDAMPVFRLVQLERISPEMLGWVRGKLRVAG